MYTLRAQWNARVAWIFILMTLLCAVPVPSAPSDGESHEFSVEKSSEQAVAFYNNGNDAYRREEYVEARDLYQHVIDLGVKHSAIYYNLGNAWFRLGRTGHAILNYERALRLNPTHKDARKNIEFVSLLIVDQITDETTEFALVDTMRRGTARIPMNLTATIFALGFIGLCITGAWWVYRGRRSGKTLFAMIFAAVLLLFAASVMGITYLVNDVGTAAIVLSKETEVRFEPAPNAKVAFVLHEGTKVWVERTEDAWALIELSSGLRGWIPLHVFEVI